MPIGDILIKKEGREVLEWLFLGIRTGMRRATEDYRQRLATDPTGAINALKRAVDLPHRTRARITQFITTYGQPRLVSIIAAANTNVTLTELNTALTTLETYATGLVNHRLNDAWTWDQVATDIETNVDFEMTRWTFPLPVGYTDVWGE